MLVIRVGNIICHVYELKMRDIHLSYCILLLFTQKLSAPVILKEKL